MNLKRCTAILLAVAMLVTLVGCNKATSARNAVERFETAMNENNYREAFAYVADYDGFGFSDGTEKIMDAVAKSMNINIVSESMGASSGTIDVDITTVDLRAVYVEAAKMVIPQYYQSAVSGVSISSEEIGNKLASQVVVLCDSGAAQTVTTRCTLQMAQNSKGEWEIRLDTASYSAITGYLDEANNLVTTGAINDSMANSMGIQTTATTTTAPVSSSDATTTAAGGQ